MSEESKSMFMPKVLAFPLNSAYARSKLKKESVGLAGTST
jgi:hypothetical protein